MRVVLVRLLIAAALLSLLGALGCKGSIVASLEPEGTMYGINIFNVPSVMQPGQVLMLGARGLYPGTATFNITAYADWVSSDPDVLELIGKGIVRAKSGGTASISCSYKGVTSQSVMIKVEGPALPGQQQPPPVVLSEIRVEPTSAAVKIDDTIQFEATAVYSNGTTQPVTTLVDWRISTDEYGFIIDSDNANAWGTTYGLFKATGPIGTVVVSCEYMDIISNYVTLVVRVY
jgi:hypothetical protein